MKRAAHSLISAVGESAWVLFAFFAVAAFVYGAAVSFIPGLDALSETTLGQLLSGGIIYALVLGLVLLPVSIRRGKAYVVKLLGIDRGPDRSIWWLPLLMWLAYMAVTVVVAIGVQHLPWIDSNEEQQVGFQDISQPLEYIMAFFALVILPPIAEELLFRGYLFGRLRERAGFWFTTIVVSIVFGFVHMQWNVGIDVAVLSVFLCYLREKTGTIWASITLHAIKNGLAYFLLFIAPLLGWNII